MVPLGPRCERVPGQDRAVATMDGAKRWIRNLHGDRGGQRRRYNWRHRVAHQRIERSSGVASHRRGGTTQEKGITSHECKIKPSRGKERKNGGVGGSVARIGYSRFRPFANGLTAQIGFSSPASGRARWAQPHSGTRIGS